MTIEDLLKTERAIWGEKKLVLSDILICSGVTYGDLCRQLRDEREGKHMREHEELMKELGNVISSTIRWCDDLGYNPEECINRALEAQRKYKGRIK